ncbi:serpin family protein [Tundrisphaera sp. TA3]|uniref:serpin family protein n=1 Tax=Tundrisphaera sp. TA3 TaxID=3435775 RepID=UPI003EB6AE01
MNWLAISLVALGLGTEPGEAPMSDVVRGNNAFALDLYGKLRAQEGNAFLSPYSISSALAMTRAGAKGETAAEMDRVLHLKGGDPAATDREFAALMSSLNGDKADRGYRLDVANRLWGMQGFHFVPEFIERTRANYGAGLERINFGQTAEAIRTINAWVASKTQYKINDLLQEGDVNAGTRLVLTNAIYFKGKWTIPFAKESTRDRPFHASASAPAPVPTMMHEGSYLYYEGDGLKAIELPYRPGDLAMDILLPDAIDGLPAIEAKLTPDNLTRWLGGLKSRRVELSLPRFTMKTKAELSKPLAALGMIRAFNPEAADFSGIATEEELSISAVIHQAFVAVDEEGTEAAAATAVVMRATAAMQPPTPPAIFRADHPFLFLIRDVRSGAILFLGRVANPKG